MSDLSESLGVALRWLEDGRRVVAATLVELEGSGPIDPGATMLIGDGGDVEGSVTGGCVEGAVVEEAGRILAGGPPVVRRYGISDALAGSVGLTCGGIVQIFVRELGAEQLEPLRAVADAIERGEPAALASLIDGPGAGSTLALVGDDEVHGRLGSPLLERNVAADLRATLGTGAARTARYGEDGAKAAEGLRVHLQPHAVAPRMIVFGANDYSAALAPAAHGLGYDVTICDAREPFLRSSRYARAATTVVGWPQDVLAGLRLSARDAVLVFTHDPKFDEPALLAALDSGAGYVGALGSRRTTADRNRRLREAGVAEVAIERIFAPCGLDIGAASAAEAAVAILAEIVAARTGREGRSLRAGEGEIRPRRAVATAR
ncbi:XdhC family protein [Conexibacter woesei]|uniref:Xanthine dehydrogenase n=1 Tax=Conexibacter woesei (strain DSM 14684 / CCUG 47730 / CIP 108061 / JCM 11494 / NBRC 100937 / ID131577) TaxID=469383 RepID=D3F4T2_CONWI|nr:XdhC/CoxI family protein [Conexibacter woesei]ADB52539.1 protein of unknown function DUF182 [Conexibacter woesei DSM 14684]